MVSVSVPEPETAETPKTPTSKKSKFKFWGSKFSRSDKTQPLKDDAEEEALSSMAEEIGGPDPIEEEEESQMSNEPSSTSNLIASAQEEKDRIAQHKLKSSHRKSIADLSRSMQQQKKKEEWQKSIKKILRSDSVPDLAMELESQLESSLKNLRLPQRPLEDDKAGKEAQEAYEMFTKEYPTEDEAMARPPEREESDLSSVVKERPVFMAPTTATPLPAQLRLEHQLYFYPQDKPRKLTPEREESDLSSVVKERPVFMAPTTATPLPAQLRLEHQLYFYPQDKPRKLTPEREESDLSSVVKERPVFMAPTTATPLPAQLRLEHQLYFYPQDKPRKLTPEREESDLSSVVKERPVFMAPTTATPLPAQLRLEHQLYFYPQDKPRKLTPEREESDLSSVVKERPVFMAPTTATPLPAQLRLEHQLYFYPQDKPRKLTPEREESDLSSVVKERPVFMAPTTATPLPAQLRLEHQLYFYPQDKPRKLTPEREESDLSSVVKERPVFMAPTTATPLPAQLRLEHQLYFYPQDKPRKLTLYIRFDVSEERAAEEGLPPIPVAAAKLGLIKDRLLQQPEKGRRWLDELGQVKNWPGSLAPFPLQPSLEDAEDLVVYCKATMSLEDTPIPYQEHGYRLDVDVGRVVFTHHPLFNTEHVLASRLLQLWLGYLQLSEQSLPLHYAQLALTVSSVERLGMQMDGVRKAMREVEESLVEKEAAEDRRRDERALRVLRDDRRNLRQSRDKALEAEQSLTMSLMSWWGRLERRRTTQGFTSTPYFLTVHEKPVEVELDRLHWETDLREAFQEEVEERRMGGEEVDEAMLWEEMQRGALEKRRRPGEPHLVPVLTNTAPVTPKDACPPEEKTRREEVEKKEVCLRLRCEDAIVVQSPARPLNADFCLAFARIFSLHLNNTPASLIVQVLERKEGCATPWEKLATVGVPVPSSTSLMPPSADPNLDDIHFSSPATIPGEEDPVAKHIREIFESLTTQDVTEEDQKEDGPVGYFRLENPELSLISEEAMNSDPRFRLLEYRREGVPEFRLARSVPAFSTELSWDVFAEYERRMEKDREGPGRLSDVHSIRKAGHKYLSMVRAEVVERLFLGQEVGSVSDVVSEEPMPTCGAIGLMLMEEAGRPLKPVRKSERTKPPVSGSAVQGGVRILINVQSAVNLPTRIGPNDKEEDVETFLEVNFQGQRVCSSAVSGNRPIWQQLLNLPFRAPNLDYSPLNLQSITDTIYFNLFDQDDREAEGVTSHNQKEKRWLGGLRLPFSTLYHAGKIDGYFRLRTPPLLLSYAHLAQDAPSRSTTHAHGHTQTHHPALKLLLAIDPPLQTPESKLGKIESIEDAQTVAYCNEWETEQKRRFPFRRSSPLVLKTDGRTALILRFLRPLAPPAEVERLRGDPKAAASLAARIVSLIPFIPDPLLFPGMPDIWSTCEEFMSMLCGDEEEHAVLLWCWLAGLDLNPLLVMGEGLPEGPRSAYVLVDFPESSHLYNASDGLEYSLTDPYCPLHTVGLVVTQENVWGNVQGAGHPSAVNWALGEGRSWRALFGKAFPLAGLSSVQAERLEYRETAPALVTELKTSLERRIKLAIDDWRQYANPRWNFAAAQALKQLLPELEAGKLTAEEHGKRLSDLTDSYVMTGFPLHMGYESTEQVLAVVRATNVHLNFHADVEFALACYIHPYPNNILSVWVYVASLIRRR